MANVGACFDTLKGLTAAQQSKYWKECIARQSYTYPNHGERECRMSQTASSTSFKPSRSTHLVDMARSGYTGFVPSKQCENIHGQTYQEMKSTARRLAKERSSGEQLRRVASGLVPKSPAQRSASEPTLSSTVGFESSSPSIFQNPQGTTTMRAGAAIPGYAGFIPGRVAGGVHGKRTVEANLQATQVRLGRYGGAPADSNWQVASEADRRETTMGAGLTGESWRSRTVSLSASQSLPSGGGWAPYQPMSTHEWLREPSPQARGFPR